jgi:hypothetical protein
MKPVHIITLVLAAFLLSAAGCASLGHHGDSKASSNSVRNQSGLLRYPYELSRKAKDLTLSLTLHASEGAFVYTVVDPRGAVAWQGRVATGQSLNETRPLKPMRGRWALTLEMENATGSYDIAWKSK